MNPSAASGRTCRFVVEVKAGVAKSPKANWDEVAAAMTNRDAQSGFIVYRSASDAKLSEELAPFHTVGNVGVLALDAEGPSKSALRLALNWARLQAIAAVRHDEVTYVDTVRIGELVSQGLQLLRAITKIKSFHTQAHRAIDSAQSQAVSMGSELDVIFGEIEEQLAA